MIDVGTAIQDCGSDYEKFDLISKQGEKIEIIRREGNPAGKWLARDTQGRCKWIRPQKTKNAVSGHRLASESVQWLAF